VVAIIEESFPVFHLVVLMFECFISKLFVAALKAGWRLAEIVTVMQNFSAPDYPPRPAIDKLMIRDEEAFVQ
jgi:hypothetical protein